MKSKIFSSAFVFLLLVFMLAACTSAEVQTGEESIAPDSSASGVSPTTDDSADSDESQDSGAETTDNNHTQADDTEDYKLLAEDGLVFNDGSSVRYEYSILDLNNDLEEGKESFNSLLSTIDMGIFITLSVDGKKILQTNNGQYEISDLKGDNVFETDVDNSKNYVCFSPNLNYYFLFDKDGDNGTIVNIQDNTTGEAQLEFHRDFTFSDDESSFGCTHYDQSSGESAIYIYDTRNSQLIYKIPIEGNEDTTYITQIHNNKKVLYTYKNDSYMIDFDGNNKTLLGHNIFYTQLSEDEKYLAYAMSYIIDTYVDIDEPDTLSSIDDRGLYIKNMITGDIKFFPYPDTYNEVLRPVKWLSFAEE